MRSLCRVARLATLAASALLITSCATAPTPPPAAEPVPEVTVEPAPPPKPPEPPKEFVVVTGGKVNVRKTASTKDAVVATAKKGEKLQTTGRQGEWYVVQLADGATTGYVHAKYVRRDEPCLPDSKPAVLSAPMMDLSATDAHGTVQLRINVDAKGDVSAVNVVSNGTGDPALAQKALADAKSMKFTPLVRKCKASGFVYVMNRTF